MILKDGWGGWVKPPNKPIAQLNKLFFNVHDASVNDTLELVLNLATQ